MKYIPKIIILIIFLSYFNKAHAVEFTINSCPSTTNLYEHMSSQVDDRISGIASSNSTKSLFSTRGNLTSSWVRSTSVWTRNISPIDFTGMSPWNSAGGYAKAGTLITPRHIALADHFPQNIGDTVLFVAEDNTVVTRVITDVRRVLATDIMIAKLDSDVPSSITHYPIIDQSTFEKYLNDGFFQSDYNNLPIVNLDQEDHAIVANTSIKSIYSNLIEYIYHIKSDLNTQQIAFHELLIGGDSGNPGFVLIGNKPVLLLTHLTSGAGPSYSFYKNDIQNAINSMGGSYTLSTMNLSCFNSPVVLEPSTSLSIVENSIIGDSVGTVGIKYNIENDTPYFSILSGNQDDVFKISTSTGQLTIASSTPLLNTSASFSLEIGVAENGPTGRLSKGLYPISFATYPYFTVQDYNFNINENQLINTVVGGVAAQDKQFDVLTYSILSGNNSGVFSISSSTGVISVANSNLLNYENQTAYTLVVEAKELNSVNRLAKSINVNIKINDTNYTFSSSSYSFSIDETNVNTTSVGNIQAQIIDPNNVSQINYSIVSGNEKNIFSINSSTGQISVIDNTELDSNNIYNLIIGVSDGVGANVLATSNVIVKVTSNTRPNVSFEPAYSSLAWKDVDEGSSLSMIINLSSAYTKSIISNLHQILGTAVLSDYVLSTSTVVFLPGEIEKTVTLNALSDSALENTEELVISLVDGIRFTPGVRKSAFIKIINKTPTQVQNSGGGGGGGGGTNSNTSQVVLPLKTIIDSATLKAGVIKNTDKINQTPDFKSAVNLITSDNQRGFGINAQGSDVKMLQQILNAQGFNVSKKGPGSKGNETNKFGTATKQALIKFQIKNNLFPAKGYFGPKTKNFIKSLIK